MLGLKVVSVQIGGYQSKTCKLRPAAIFNRVEVEPVIPRTLLGYFFQDVSNDVLLHESFWIFLAATKTFHLPKSGTGQNNYARKYPPSFVIKRLIMKCKMSLLA